MLRKLLSVFTASVIFFTLMFIPAVSVPADEYENENFNLFNSDLNFWKTEKWMEPSGISDGVLSITDGYSTYIGTAMSSQTVSFVMNTAVSSGALQFYFRNSVSAASVMQLPGTFSEKNGGNPYVLTYSAEKGRIFFKSYSGTEGRTLYGQDGEYEAYVSGLNDGNSHIFRIETSEDFKLGITRLTLYIDGKQILEVTDENIKGEGYMSFVNYSGGTFEISSLTAEGITSDPAATSKILCDFEEENIIDRNVSITTADAHSGASALLYDDSVSGNSFFTVGGALQKALIGGQSYRITAWVKPVPNGSGKSIEFSLRENNAGGKIEGGVETDVKTTFSYYGLNNNWAFLLDEDKNTGWQKVLICNEYVPSDEYRYPYFRLYSDGGGNGWYIDDICFESVLDCTLNVNGDGCGTLSYTNHSYLLADTNSSAPVSALSICKGDRITVTAVSDEGSAFSGWYDEDYNLLTYEKDYTFIASGNTVFNAVFLSALQGRRVIYDFENPETDIIDGGAMSVSAEAAYSGNYGVCVCKPSEYAEAVWSVVPAAEEAADSLDPTRKYRVSIYVKSNSEQASGAVDLTLYFASQSNTSAYGGYKPIGESLSRWGITQGHIISCVASGETAVSAEEWNKIIICDEFSPQENGIYPVLTVYAGAETAFDWSIDRLEFCELTDIVCKTDNDISANISYVKNGFRAVGGKITEDTSAVAVGDTITPVIEISDGYFLKGLYINGDRIFNTSSYCYTVNGCVRLFAAIEEGCNLINYDSAGWLLSQQYGGSAVIGDTLVLTGNHGTATYTRYKIRNHTVTIRYIARIENEWAGIMLQTDAEKQYLEKNPGMAFSAQTNPYVLSITQKRTTLRKFNESGEISTLCMPDIPTGAISGQEHELKITCSDSGQSLGVTVSVYMDGREIIFYNDESGRGAASYISFICMSPKDSFTVTYFGVDGVSSDKWSELNSLYDDINKLSNIDIGSGDVQNALSRFDALSALDRELIENSALLETAVSVYERFCENNLAVRIPAKISSDAAICTSQKRVLRFFGTIDSTAVGEYQQSGFTFIKAGMVMLPADKSYGGYTLKTADVKSCVFSAEEYDVLSSFNVYLNGFTHEARNARRVSARSFAVFECEGLTVTVYSSECALESLYNAAVKQYNSNYGTGLESTPYNGLYALTFLEEGEENGACVSFSQPNTFLFDGIGAEIDPHIFRSINTEHGFCEEDWQLICRRIKDMGLDKIRMMVMPEWYEPENENSDPFITDMEAFSWDNQDMYSVYRVLDMAEEYGIKVNITVWGANASAGSWLAYSQASHWISPPNDLDEWSENISALLKQLITVKKYTCIKELTPYNEPADAYYITSPSEISFANYKQMVINLHNRLVSDGVRNLTELCTSDDGTKPAWLEQCVSDSEFAAVSDSFNSHCYKLPVDASLAQTAEYAKRLLDIASPSGKRFTLNEFGSSTTGAGDYTDDGVMDTYQRGMLYGKLVTGFLGEGCAGMLHWCLFDQYYGEDKLMYRGLWKYRDKNWENRPVYYALSMITANTVPDSEVYKGVSSREDCAATALKSPEGKWTYIAVNESVENRVIKLENRQVSAGGSIYIYSEYSLKCVEGDVMPAVGIAEAENTTLTFVIPANSFAVVVCE